LKAALRRSLLTRIFWVAVVTVLLKKPGGSVLQVERYPDSMLA
jgi:hypothetical protein